MDLGRGQARARLGLGLGLGLELGLGGGGGYTRWRRIHHPTAAAYAAHGGWLVIPSFRRWQDSADEVVVVPPAAIFGPIL